MHIKSKNETNKRKTEPKPPKKITESYLQNSGLYYLQRFPSSSANFKSVMMRKVKRSCAYHKDQDSESCEAMVNQLTKKFEEYGLLDDVSYTKGMITSLRNQGKSERLIFAKLSSKGLTHNMIRDALLQYDEAHSVSDLNAEQQAALKFAKKRRIGPFRKENENFDEKARNKELGALARAGFRYDVCAFILEQDKENNVYLSDL